MRRKILAIFIVGFTILLPVFAQTDGTNPVGANTAQDLYAPLMAGAAGFSTSRGGAPASALNPAAEGEALRMQFDLGYLALPAFGDERGFGLGAINLGATFPTNYAVFGGSLWFLRSPFESFPLETVFQANLNAAKQIYPGMSLGAGFNLGYNTGNNMTFSGDLGFRYNMGRFGPLENFTWALTARSLGKSWVPPMLTPAAGVAFDLLHIPGKDGGPDPLRMGLAGDLMLPTGQNLAGKLGMQVLVAELVNISTSTQFNLRESIDGKAPSPVPSIGIGLNLKMGAPGQTMAGGALPSEGNLAVNMAAKPLYNGIWAMGSGVSWSVGVADRNPPRIFVQYPEPVWISPNNDGRADYLEFPINISISDERIIESWVFEISDESGNPVRTIRNREPWPDSQGVQNIINRLGAVKAGIEVPANLRWDGGLEAGGVAADGRYFFNIRARDDSGKIGRAGPYQVHVRNTPPQIALTPFEDDVNIFAPGTSGAKDSLTIGQNGSHEDLWEAGIYDISGRRVRSFNLREQEPQTFVWDGTGDSGLIVPDGVYTYRISATDRALNTSEASLENIIVSTIRPVVGINIADAFFSPNGDGVKDTMIFDLSVPARDGIAEWELQISDNRGALQRSFSGTSTGISDGRSAGSSEIPARLEFDGRDSAGRLLPEAAYTASLSVRYRNGHLSSANSPNFTLDITPPRALVEIEDRDQGPGFPAVFSPNNTGFKDELIIVQEGSSELSWIGEIRPRGIPGAPVIRTFRFSGNPPRRFSWDGINNDGALAADGLYTYLLYSTDQAGNTGRSNVVEFELNTRDTPVFVATNLRAFSPNGDGVRDTINIIPQIQETDGIMNWRMEIFNIGSGLMAVEASTTGAASVRSFQGGSNAPALITWDGRTHTGAIAPDGSYVARLDVEYRAGSRPTALSMAFNIRTVPPQAEVSVPYYIFAPNGNGNRETLPIFVTTQGHDEWNAAMLDSRNNPVRSWNWTGRAPELVWDGKDQAGNPVPDGMYSFALVSTDDAGNSARRIINNIELDARIPQIFLTASSPAIAPRANQAEAMRFNLTANITSGVEFWKLELRDENNNLVKSFPSASGGRGALPAAIPWNGADEQGRIREGSFNTNLTVNYTKGDAVSVSSAPVLVDISGPILGFFSQPDYFSPDNDGVNDELFIFLSARDASPIAEWSLELRETEGTRQLFYRTGGRGSPADRIIWDGRSNWGELVQSATDYEFNYSAADALGNSSSISGFISTDVLVIRDGDILRIQIPSIVFRANHADFIGIPQDRLENNMRVLRRIAEILNRFRDYGITVEGHANPVLGTAREENEVLMPLSLERARFVIDHLAGIGVSRNRLSPTGQGGSINVANPGDQDNSWKNRRVEFLLIR
ncbi:MAG: cell envelope biogenesis protein OmpA [Treponema sp.]|nr:cell envelope biogenesis protein OmpA [Treponema sp.]